MEKVVNLSFNKKKDIQTPHQSKKVFLRAIYNRQVTAE